MHRMTAPRIDWPSIAGPVARALLGDTIALWIAVTWIHNRLEISPFLNLTSATKRCGKSLLLEVLGELVYRPLPVGGRRPA